MITVILHRRKTNPKDFHSFDKIILPYQKLLICESLFLYEYRNQYVHSTKSIDAQIIIYNKKPLLMMAFDRHAGRKDSYAIELW